MFQQREITTHDNSVMIGALYNLRNPQRGQGMIGPVQPKGIGVKMKVGKNQAPADQC